MAVIQKPDLLDSAVVFSLNDAALLNNHCIMFLGKQEPLLNRAPSSYAEACEMFVTGLYKVYHELGMKFLLCYCTGIAEVISQDKFLKHIKFITNCRAAFQHSGDDGSRTLAMKTIKSFFKSDSTFSFSDWNDFWKNASESVWKKITEKIVKDSNELCGELKNISSGQNVYSRIIQNVAKKFQDGKFIYYNDTNGKSADIFCDSLDSRFFKIIKQTLRNENAFLPNEQLDAMEELNALVRFDDDNRTQEQIDAGKKSPNEIRDDIVAMIRLLLNNITSSPLTSEQLYDDVKAEVKLQIKKQLKANHEATISALLS